MPKETDLIQSTAKALTPEMDPLHKTLERSLLDLEQSLEWLDGEILRIRKTQVERDQIYKLVTQMRYMLGKGPYRPPFPSTEDEKAGTAPLG